MYKTNCRNLILSFVVVLVSATSAQVPNILINEFLSSNAYINYDPHLKEYSDWIELFNKENSPVNLKGYSLTDNLNNPTKWIIQADLTIPANDYLIIWADDNDFENHANFKLSQDGEQIGLYSPSGAVVDTISFKYQKTDISYGRNPNNNSSWLYYYAPTPHRINNSIGNLDMSSCLAPVFSEESGFYVGDLTLELRTESGSQIRYTLDGSEPDENSEIYSSPITIVDRSQEPNYFSNIPTNAFPYSWLPVWQPPAEIVRKGTIVRAKAFASNKLPSEIITNTFFIGSELSGAFNTIPVISLVSDEKHLFSDSAGIYVPGESYTGIQGQGNYMQDWNRPAHFEFFDEQGYSQISQEVNIRTQGSTSRTSPQKGLHIIASNLYGKGSLDYPFFQNSPSKANKITSFRRIMIRAWGTVWNQGMVNDALAQLSYANSSVDIQDYRPTIVFINGEYWGLHEIREANKNPYYFQDHHGVDRNNPGIDLLSGGLSEYLIDEGDDEHWNSVKTFIDNNDLAQSQNYNKFNTLIDIDNFLDYMGHCVFFAKIDWPRGNEAFWRPKTLDGRWKWIQFDMDLCFSLPDYDMFNHVFNGTDQRARHTILSKLIKNSEFKNQFINWFLDRLNSEFKTQELDNNYNNILNGLYPYLQEHLSRWAIRGNNFGTFTGYIRNFISRRGSIVQNQLKSHFGLEGELNPITIERNTPGGIVRVNTVTIDGSNASGQNTFPWIGQYFSDVPIKIIAEPYDGFTFNGWVGSIQSNSDSISTYLTDNSWISAVFSPIQKIDSLYINEFLVNNRNIVDDSEKATSWIEFYNAGTDTVNIKGLFLTDNFLSPVRWNISTLDKSSLAFPPKEYKVLFCNDTSNNQNYDFNTILNSAGGQLGLVQVSGTDTAFVDSISYPIQFPNVTYGRLPQSTNNWAFLLRPTPGAQNIYSPSGSVLKNQPELIQSYPNPFSNIAVIPFYLPDLKNYSLSIFDIRGTLIKEFNILPQIPGYRSIVWDGQDSSGKTVPSGVYFCSLFSDKLIQTKKILYIK